MCKKRQTAEQIIPKLQEADPCHNRQPSQQVTSPSNSNVSNGQARVDFPLSGFPRTSVKRAAPRHLLHSLYRSLLLIPTLPMTDA
jgi:hypothetical protein